MAARIIQFASLVQCVLAYKKGLQEIVDIEGDIYGNSSGNWSHDDLKWLNIYSMVATSHKEISPTTLADFFGNASWRAAFRSLLYGPQPRAGEDGMITASVFIAAMRNATSWLANLSSFKIKVHDDATKKLVHAWNDYRSFCNPPDGNFIEKGFQGLTCAFWSIVTSVNIAMIPIGPWNLPAAGFRLGLTELECTVWCMKMEGYMKTTHVATASLVGSGPAFNKVFSGVQAGPAPDKSMRRGIAGKLAVAVHDKSIRRGIAGKLADAEYAGKQGLLATKRQVKHFFVMGEAAERLITAAAGFAVATVKEGAINTFNYLFSQPWMPHLDALAIARNLKHDHPYCTWESWCPISDTDAEFMCYDTVNKTCYKRSDRGFLSKCGKGSSFYYSDPIFTCRNPWKHSVPLSNPCRQIVPGPRPEPHIKCLNDVWCAKYPGTTCKPDPVLPNDGVCECPKKTCVDFVNSNGLVSTLATCVDYDKFYGLS